MTTLIEAILTLKKIKLKNHEKVYTWNQMSLSEPKTASARVRLKRTSPQRAFP